MNIYRPGQEYYVEIQVGCSSFSCNQISYQTKKKQVPLLAERWIPIEKKKEVLDRKMRVICGEKSIDSLLSWKNDDST